MGVAPDHPDLSRLASLQEELGLELPEIVETLIAELDRSLQTARRALTEHDLGTAALAAHAGTSSALMLDARRLLAALGDLERGARTGEAATARTALAQLEAAWSELRRTLLTARAAGSA